MLVCDELLLVSLGVHGWGARLLCAIADRQLHPARALHAFDCRPPRSYPRRALRCALTASPHVPSRLLDGQVRVSVGSKGSVFVHTRDDGAPVEES